MSKKKIFSAVFLTALALRTALYFHAAAGYTPDDNEPFIDVEEDLVFLHSPEESETAEDDRYSDYNLIARIVMAEAEGESELGKRLVIDTILNRVDSDRFPDTVREVVYQKNQFSCITNGRFDRVGVTDALRVLIAEEIDKRTNYDVVFFNAVGYTRFGKALFKEGNHYFSSL